MSIAVVGARYRNRQGAARRAEISLCSPGDALEIRHERRAPASRAIAAYSERGVQLGYISPGNVEQVGGQIAVVRAIFQRQDAFGAVIRLTFDGSTPRLPEPPSRLYRASELPPEPKDEFCDI